MPRCLSEGVDIFLKSVERQGESGHDVRVSRSAPWMARVGDPVILRTAISLFIRKFTPGDATLRRDVPFAVGVRGFFTNSQFTQSQLVSDIHSPFLFGSSMPDSPDRSDSLGYSDPAYAKHLREVSVLRLPNW